MYIHLKRHLIPCVHDFPYALPRISPINHRFPRIDMADENYGKDYEHHIESNAGCGISANNPHNAGMVVTFAGDPDAVSAAG